MEEIIDLINNSNLNISEYEKIKYLINTKINNTIENINKNDYSSNLFTSIKNYKTNNLLLLDLINKINNIKVSYDNALYIYFEYIDFNIELTIYYDDDNEKIKILDIYKKNNMNQVCFYVDHEQNFIKTLGWHIFVNKNEIYDFFEFMFNSLPNYLYKW